MKIGALFICLVLAWAVVHADDEHSLMSRFMEAAKTCKEEAGGGTKMGECFKTFAEGGDTTTPEFNLCKCTGACIAGKFDTLNDDLSWKWDQLREINNEIKSYGDGLYEEGQEIIKQCENKVGGAGDKCDAALKLFECAMKTSDMAKKLAEKIANKMK